MEPIVALGRNCWKIEHASCASVIIDAADYYHFVRQAMDAAESRILIIGWQFDTRILLEPREGEQTLGQYFLTLAHQKPDRRIDVLKWSFGAKKQLLHLSAIWMLLRWQGTKAIDLRFDGAHPPGCSHHQKIVVIDDQFAVCGGIDISIARWDTSDHSDDNANRRHPNGHQYGPWHDVTMAMIGNVAGALSELGRDRWHIATGVKLEPVNTPPHDLWPKDLAVDFENVDIAIARTRAEYEDVKDVREIEALNLDMIAAAKRFIYIENQYFTSARIAAAIASRMEEENPPEIVMVVPRTADGWLEQIAMDAARVQIARAIAKVDHKKRFRIYVPVTKGQTDIYVHAKVSIVDDRFLRVGSSNLNNRSLGLDSECDVMIDAALDANGHTPPAITAIRTRLMAEHLDVSPEHFAEIVAQHGGSLIDAIETLRGEGKTLDPLDLVPPGPLDEFIADNELLDPESPDAFLEPMSKRGLRKHWSEGKAWFKRRRGSRRAARH
ncbi:MAG: phospholipase D-like domain-containing protein [Sphingomonadaceae bacterium]